MDAVLTLDPKFDGVGIQPISTPVGRPRHRHGDVVRFGRTRAIVRDTEAPRLARHGRGQRLARVHRLALLTGPGPDLFLPATGAEIGVILEVRERLDLALGAHLPVQVIPVEYDG